MDTTLNPIGIIIIIFFIALFLTLLYYTVKTRIVYIKAMSENYEDEEEKEDIIKDKKDNFYAVFSFMIISFIFVNCVIYALTKTYCPPLRICQHGEIYVFDDDNKDNLFF